MDRDLLHKTATRIAPAGDIKTESNGNGNGHGFGKAASNNGHASAAATADSSNGDALRTPKKRRKVNHGEFSLTRRETGKGSEAATGKERGAEEGRESERLWESIPMHIPWPSIARVQQHG